MPTAKSAPDPWSLAAALRLTRYNPLTQRHEPLDPGVNFFVLALEELGAQTHFSCEGHPSGFYVVFSAPYELAWQIARTHTFSVQLEADGRWSLRMHGHEQAESRRTRRVDPQHVAYLRAVAQKWVSELGVGKKTRKLQEQDVY